MAYSLREASDATGRTKSSILRAIQKGTISATRDPLGQWRIEPAELHRVYPPGGPPRDARNGAESTAAQLAELQGKLETERAKAALLQEQVADLREDRDRWRTQAEQVNRLLEDKRPSRRRWWPFRRAGYDTA